MRLDKKEFNKKVSNLIDSLNEEIELFIRDTGFCPLLDTHEIYEMGSDEPQKLIFKVKGFGRVKE